MELRDSGATEQQHLFVFLHLFTDKCMSMIDTHAQAWNLNIYSLYNMWSASKLLQSKMTWKLLVQGVLVRSIHLKCPEQEELCHSLN